VRLTRRSSLATVAASVAATLARAGIRAVLTGGACATLYSEGKYQSFDLDFILQSATSVRDLDAAMKAVGFRRTGNHYEHPRSRFVVEFPAGPLGIGGDLDIRPTTFRIGRVQVRALSATDSCRDRLAAYFHWNDRQSLAAAVEIGRRRRLNIGSIRRWSENEGATEKFGTFLEFLRSRAPSRGRPRRT
jgi:hypothetical protein